MKLAVILKALTHPYSLPLNSFHPPSAILPLHIIPPYPHTPTSPTHSRLRPLPHLATSAHYLQLTVFTYYLYAVEVVLQPEHNTGLPPYHPHSTPSSCCAMSHCSLTFHSIPCHHRCCKTVLTSNLSCRVTLGMLCIPSIKY